MRKQKNKIIKAYGINHAARIIIGFCSYQVANYFIDNGTLDWCGDVEQFNKLDKEDIKDYSTVISMQQ